MRKSLTEIVVAGLAAAVLLGAPAAAFADAGQITFVDGKAFRQAGGKGDKAALAQDGTVQQGDVLTTGARSRLEVTLSDKSVLRLGPSSELVIEDAEVQDDGRKVDTKLVLGNVKNKRKG